MHTRAELRRLAHDRFGVRNQIEAGRWRSIGLAVATHPGPLAVQDRRQAALINCGPRSVLTSFTAVETFGLLGSERDDVHVAVPRGVRVRLVPELGIVVHHVRDWSPADVHPIGRRHRIAPALVRAASSFAEPRPAYGLLAAAVQQRLVRPADLLDALAAAQRTAHRRLLIAAVHDIEMGAQALSEIDFVRLCRRHHLPAPQLQVIRSNPDGRRRYLDAEWKRADGRRVVAEVDGALHLRPLNWIDDQLRQNELALQNSLVLRFPAVVLRTHPSLVVAQLARALGIAGFVIPSERYAAPSV